MKQRQESPQSRRINSQRMTTPIISFNLFSLRQISLICATAFLMSACGDDSGSSKISPNFGIKKTADADTGSDTSSDETPSNDNSSNSDPELSKALLKTPVQVMQITGAELKANMEKIDSTIAKDIPDAICDVKVQKISYPTVGAAGEATTATAALMIPTGDNSKCQGERPILLHTHGTAVEQSYDFSQVGSSTNSAGTRSAFVAANFATQGYIIVAPNYAGYDESTLDYHPYLNAKQQSHEMKHALDAARAALAMPTKDTNTNRLF